MKVAILSYEFPFETGFGGIGTYSYNHARGLAGLGWEVHVIAGSTKQRVVDYKHEDGFWITRARAGGFYRGFFDFLSRHGLVLFAGRLENALVMFQQLRRLHRLKRFDIVEMPECGAEGFFINRFFPGLKKCVKFHSPICFIGRFYKIGRIDHRMGGWLEKSALKKGDFYSAPSRYMADEVKRFFKLKKPVSVLQCGFDFSTIDECPPEDIRSQYGIPEEHRIIVFTSRVEQRKGADLFKTVIPMVLKSYPASHFIIAGRWDEQPYIKNRIEREVARVGGADRLVFTGRVDHTRIINILKQSDVFVHPSRWENCPNSVIEAMACGCCIVASRVGGIPEMVEDGVSGTLVEVDDAVGFAEAICRMLENPDLRGTYSRKAIEKARSTYDYVELAGKADVFYRANL